MPRSPHSGRPNPHHGLGGPTPGLVLLPLLALVLGLAAALAPGAVAAPSGPPSLVRAAATTGTVTGWGSAPSAVRAGSTYVARVRVSGGARPVHLQRRVDGAWRTVAKAGSSSTGLVRLAWRAPSRAGKVVLRVHAPRSGSRAAISSAARTITVKPSLVGTVVSTLTPLLTDVLSLVNDARRSGYTCGGTRYPAVPALTGHAALNRAAQKYAVRMATEDFFSHDSPDGTDPGERITAEGYDWRAWGENIAAGQRSASEVVSGWLQSTGHCQNIMNGAFTEIGLGYAYDADSRYGTYWVQDFGDR